VASPGVLPRQDASRIRVAAYRCRIERLFSVGAAFHFVNVVRKLLRKLVAMSERDPAPHYVEKVLLEYGIALLLRASSGLLSASITLFFG
jgi:hypothetical protein